MAQLLLGVSDWKTFLLDPLPEQLPKSPMPPSVGITLQLWETVCNQALPMFPYPPHHITDLQIDSWLQRGLTSLEDLYDGSSSLSFPDLQLKYGIPPADLFKYLQIVHLLRPLTTKQKAVPTQVLSLL